MRSGWASTPDRARFLSGGTAATIPRIGGASGPAITLPSAVLRASALQLMGSGIGSVPFDRLVHATGAVLAAAVPAGLRVATRSVRLEDVEQAWSASGDAARTVFRVA